VFYGADQAGIHDREFGKLAGFAAADLLQLLSSGGHPTGTVVDLGCGSGLLARVVTDAGYDVVGVDISPDMVALARQHAPRAEFTVGSLHDFRLPEGCVAVTATGEALNYGAGMASVARLAERVVDALVAGGVFLFDVAGPGRAGSTGSTRQFHRRDDWCLGMIATESEQGGRLDREITIFVSEDDGRYRRVDEHHVLRLYDRDALASLLTEAGLVVNVLDDYRSPTTHPKIPGWYVVEAKKPR